MDVDEICRYQLPPMRWDARLFLWRVAAMQDEALAVMKAWGFTLKAEIIWIKTTRDGLIFIDTNAIQNDEIYKDKHLTNIAYGNGFQTHMCHEVCLIGVRGKPERTGHFRSVFFAPRGEHSEKPQKFYDIVSAMSPGPRFSMFSRIRRDGWMCDGDEIPDSFMLEAA